MGKTVNKDGDSSTSVPERRSLRHSKVADEDSKTIPLAKRRKLIGKKKEEKAEEKRDQSPKEVEETNGEKNHEPSTDVDGENSKPTTSRRSGRKRQISDSTDPEAESSKKVDDKDDVSSKPKKGGKEENYPKVKNGRMVAKRVEKRKKRKPPTKKKKVEQDESELWTPLEPLDSSEKRDVHKGSLSKADRRKQALVERQAPAEPMLQKQLPRHRRASGASDCEVLGSVHRNQRRPKPIVTVDIDDEASETGSIQIVAEPDVDSVFDFKRLLIQYRNVNLPSSLWGAHKDPRNLFVSFTRFNPDYPEMNGAIVDRAVIFSGSLNPEAFINGLKIELPEMFNSVETIYEAAQVIQFVNNSVSPVNCTVEEPSDIVS